MSWSVEAKLLLLLLYTFMLLAALEAFLYWSTSSLLQRPLALFISICCLVAAALFTAARRVRHLRSHSRPDSKKVSTRRSAALKLENYARHDSSDQGPNVVVNVFCRTLMAKIICDNILNGFRVCKRKLVPLTLVVKSASPDLVVMGGYSIMRGCEFDYQYRIQDW